MANQCAKILLKTPVKYSTTHIENHSNRINKLPISLYGSVG